MLLLHVCVSKTETPFNLSSFHDAEVQALWFSWRLTIGVVVQTVYAQEGVRLFDLSGSDLCHGLDWVQPTVLSQGHWDYL